MKSNMLKFATCLIVAFGLMLANNVSAQDNGGKVPTKGNTSGSGQGDPSNTGGGVNGGKAVDPPSGDPTMSDTPSGYKAKSDCIQVRALAKKKGGELPYKVTIDYGQGKVQNETHTMKIDQKKTSGMDCKCYPKSENITVTYVKNAKISKVNVTESDKCN